MKGLLKRIFRRRAFEEELREEVESHIQMRAEHNKNSGMDEDEAVRVARKQFGNRGLILENVRTIHFSMWAETIRQDIRYALRSFRRAPGFSLAALLALALGIGTTTAVFSAVDRILFRSLPYPAGDRMVSFGAMAPLDTNEFVLSADWFDWRVANTPFESMTTLQPGSDACDLGGDTPLRLSCVRVESTFLATFGIPPVVGRDFTPEEDVPNGPKVAIISHGLWRDRFGSNTAIAGQSVLLNGIATIILGVLPVDFEMPNLGRADILVPQALPFVSHPNSGRPLRAFGRLKPNVTVEQARSALMPIFQNSLQWVPEAFRNEVTLRVRSLQDRQVQDVRLMSWVLFGSVLAVLLIACANVSNLLLARAASRHREFAVRSAIGASRWRLTRQTLTESFVLALTGCALGCGLAALILRLILGIAPTGIPRLAQATLDVRGLLFAVSISTMSGLFFGLAPALRRPAPHALVNRSAVGGRGVVRQSLVASQIAVSIILLSGAGLLLRTLWNLQNVPLGMNTENVLTVPILLGPQRYGTSKQQRVFFEEIEERLRSKPGFEAVAVSDSIPLGGTVSDITGQLGTRSTLYASLSVEGRPAIPKETGGLVAWRRVSPDYFRALNIPILRGRSFLEEDRSPGQAVMIISESLAQRLFPNEDAVGRRMLAGGSGSQSPLRTIIGVAANVKNNPGLSGLDDPEYYLPRQHDDLENVTPRAAVILRTPLGVEAAASTIRRTIAEIDAALPVNVYSMEQRVDELVAGPRFNAALLTWFAFGGVLLAAIGLYSVISFLVVQRTQEIGIRLALGATTGNILSLVLWTAMRWTTAGILLGLVGSFFATRLLRTLLFRVQEHDPLSLSLTIAIMLLVALFAGWVPSRRASRTDPMVALRQD